MIEHVWDTHQPPAPAFLERWQAIATRAPQFNFTMDADFLAWEARHGRHALAAIDTDDGRRTALVLRREGAAFVSGYPWRWQAADEAPPEDEIVVPSPARAAAWFRAAAQLAGAARLRMFLPRAPQAPGFPAGQTLFVRLDRDDEALLAGMDSDKRRAIKRAAKDGWNVAPARGLAEFRRYGELQRETNTWRDSAATQAAAEDPAPGEGWREWEHPWMRLFVAARQDEIGSGSGFGFVRGGTIDYRTNASRPDARKSGANAALAFEALRFGREQGCRLMNWGGVTRFKLDLGGETLALWCWLGGGPLWAPVNLAEAACRQVVRAGATRWKSLSKRTAKTE